MIITGNDEEEISRLQDQLTAEFETKNLENLTYFLRIELVSQQKYILDLLAKVGLVDSKHVGMPIIHNYRPGEYSDQKLADKERY